MGVRDPNKDLKKYRERKMAIRGALLKLNNGVLMPQFGLGTWQSKPGEVKVAVEAAIDAGYRHIDCAWVYGNEDEVGAGVRQKIKEGIIKREELFITSKLWNIFHQPVDVKRGFQMSLQKFGLDYIDLYLMHFPMGFKNINDNPMPMREDGKGVEFDEVDYLKTYHAMESLMDGGQCRALGVSNFNEFQIARLLKESKKYLPTNNQIEINPFFNNDGLVKFCQKNDVVVTAYSPLGNPSAPPTRKWDEKHVPLIKDKRLLPLAKKYKKSPAQILLRYALDRNLCVIPKSTSPSRILDNADIFDFELEIDEVDFLLGLELGFRVVELSHNSSHKYFPHRKDYSE